MKKLFTIALVSIALSSAIGCSQNKKDEVTDLAQPEYLYFDVIAVDNNAAGTVTPSHVLTIKINP